MRRIRTAVTALVVAAALTSCEDESSDASGGGPTAFSYSAERVAPERSDLPETGSETEPDPEDALAELELDNGAQVVIWSDPEDSAEVSFQHSDPDDPGGWTEPELIFEAGDGCLFLDAATNGEVVAVGLGCYEGDAFIQQAPDQGVALVTPDLVTWDAHEVEPEFYGEPEVSDDGEVTWVNGVYEDEEVHWTDDDGFSESG